MRWTRHDAPASASHTDSTFRLIEATIAFSEELPHVCTIFPDENSRRVYSETKHAVRALQEMLLIHGTRTSGASYTGTAALLFAGVCE
jgi:hypothetical protein